MVIFLYFLNHLNLLNRFANMCPLNIEHKISQLNREILAHFRFWMSKFVVKTVNLTIVFAENIYLLGFSQIMKVSFQCTEKRGLLHTLLHQSFSICCDFKTFHFEIDHLKTILIKNYYPLKFRDSCIKSFLNKLYKPKVMVPNVP